MNLAVKTYPPSKRIRGTTTNTPSNFSKDAPWIWWENSSVAMGDLRFETSPWWRWTPRSARFRTLHRSSNARASTVRQKKAPNPKWQSGYLALPMNTAAKQPLKSVNSSVSTGVWKTSTIGSGMPPTGGRTGHRREIQGVPKTWLC